MPQVNGLRSSAVAAAILAVGCGAVHGQTAPTIVLRSVPPGDADGGAVAAYGLTLPDQVRIVGTVPGVEGATASRELPLTIRRDDRSFEGRLVATFPEYLTLIGAEVGRGRSLTAEDGQSFAEVVVLGAAAAERLFGAEDPVGEAVRVAGQDLMVVGVLKPRRASPPEAPGLEGWDVNADVYMPHTTCRLRLGERVLVRQGGRFRPEECAISRMVLNIRRGRDIKAILPHVREDLRLFHPDGDVEVIPVEGTAPGAIRPGE